MTADLTGPAGDAVTRPALTTPARLRPGPVIAFDVGGTKLRAALADGAGAIVAELTEPTAGHAATALIAQLRRIGDDLQQGAATPVIAVGLALPVVIDRHGGAATSVHNIPALAGVDLARALGGAFAAPVAFDNDADLAALAEGRRGAAVGCRDFVVLAIGTGIGMGIVAGGVMVRGAHGAAGEVGFLPLGADPRDDASRERGAFERAAAGPAVRRRVDAAAAAGARFAPGAGLDEVAAAADAGDAAARSLLDDEARLIATGIAAVVAVLDPELVVLSGGVGAVEALRAPVRREAAALMVRPPRIVTSLLGDRGPLVGAIELARDLGAIGGPEVVTAR